MNTTTHTQAQSSSNIEQFQRRFLRECHRSGQGALEVAVIWKGHLLKVDQYRKTQPITVGSADGCTYAIESDAVGQKFTLLDATPDGQWALNLGACWDGLVLIDPPPQGQRQYQVSELVGAGFAKAKGQTLRLQLNGGTRAKLVFGELVVLIHQVTVHTLRLPVQVRSMSGILLGLAITLCAYMIFGGLVAYSTERSAGIRAVLEDMDMSSHILRHDPIETKLTRLPDPVDPVTEPTETVPTTKPITTDNTTQTPQTTKPAQGATPGNIPSNVSGNYRRVVNTAIGSRTDKLTSLSKLGGNSQEIATNLTQGFDGQTPNPGGDGLTMKDAGCFGPFCGGPTSINGGMDGNSNIPGGKDSDKPGPQAPGLEDKRTPKVPNPKITGGDIQTSYFDKQAIKRVVNLKKAEITQCYNKELIKTPSLKGKITIKWRILSSGNVGEVSITGNEMNNPAVASCLKARIAGWKFPVPRNNSSSDVTYPFIFSAR